MTIVTGDLKSVLGAALTANIGQMVFRLNAPNVAAVGANAGTVYPTKEERDNTTSSGSWSINLASTETMHGNAWYDVGIVWNESEGTFWDFGLKIRVPSSGTHRIQDLLVSENDNGGGSGANQLLVWVGERPPISAGKGQWWFQPSTNNLYRWE